ncbi:MAG: NAD(P)-dependent oxidoreductase [Desulfobacterales bacterium]|nr:NAD(P)-dependent oxidoreductase [Desulfobacterales bacterium]
MKKVLVTGGAGFLGSHIADALTDKGYEVLIFDRVKSSHIRDNQKMVMGDICDFDSVSAAVKGCDIVYHLAAEADIAASAKDPHRTIDLNVGGTLNFLKACVEHKVERLVFASTIYVYSELGSFYRISKQTCEKLIEEYAREFGLRFSILRFGSLYGPRANAFNGIHNMIRQAVETGKIVRQGDDEAVREYIHVKDAADLCVKILGPEYENSHLIITGPQRSTIKELMALIDEIFNHRIEIIYKEGIDKAHYKLTPYSYNPQSARRITPDLFYDMGQGLLEVIEDIKHSEKGQE